ncbi:hypothetical protein GXM_05639 [Nostoc sphaeroides CCNUC1]|uniref:Uncharacterized protein n=1 Tax=Nostoc sphaeroides CCNUC1 TaxID=2653204 RepID=A0A5P8W5X7_9NOSO|nr:hypothetical protein GXM_05639 [Nostoc sphaeroides CCNUC1]
MGLKQKSLLGISKITFEPQRRREHREKKRDFTSHLERASPNIVSGFQSKI